ERDSQDFVRYLDDESFRRRLRVAADMLKPFKEMGKLKGVCTEMTRKSGHRQRR
ncbi:MAG: hypothetical protein HC808_08865, partial [Candidatus Competibacteraceae bacterium]|nr:hypothetical protein [Candidatus Competibacteraceae bacterium]